MVNDEYILSKGYTKYPQTVFDNDIVTCRFQKCFRDELGKKYFIDILKIDRAFIPSHLREEYWKPYSYEYGIQITVGKDEKPINMQFFSNWNLEQVESFAEDFFVKMNVNYYEINDAQHILPD